MSAILPDMKPGPIFLRVSPANVESLILPSELDPSCRAEAGEAARNDRMTVTINNESFFMVFRSGMSLWDRRRSHDEDILLQDDT